MFKFDPKKPCLYTFCWNRPCAPAVPSMHWVQGCHWTWLTSKLLRTLWFVNRRPTIWYFPDWLYYTFLLTIIQQSLSLSLLASVMIPTMNTFKQITPVVKFNPMSSIFCEDENENERLLRLGLYGVEKTQNTPNESRKNAISSNSGYATDLWSWSITLQNTFGPP